MGGEILNIPLFMLPLLAAVLTAVAWKLVAALLKKWGVDLSESQERALRSSVRRAIGGAEEWAARELKIDKAKKSGGEKEAWVRMRLKKLYPDLLDDDLALYIDEELARINGVGASGELNMMRRGE